MTVLVTGAAGFVGRHAVRALAERELRVRALVRDVGGAGALDGVDCELVRGDMTDSESLRAAVAGCETVVHLAAILTGSARDFERVMTQGTRDLLDAARAAGVSRFVHMSALGTTRETSGLVPYYGAKWAMEESVRACGIPSAILRPSFVFGPDGGALPRFARIARLAPVTPIVGPGTQRLQPIWVDDVAAYLAAAVLDASRAGLVELGGPDVVTWNELWARLKGALGVSRPALHVPFWLMRPAAALVERFPGAPVTRDQLKMLAAGDNVVSDPAPMESFGLARVPLDKQLRRAVNAPADDAL
ncbi:MAG TPA: NAD-dependent epimerase/dehydratase family protein [Gaiellaceae bacterium]